LSRDLGVCQHSGRVPTLRFGTFELQTEARELRRAGARVRLQPQPFRVLEALAARPGQVVSREELRRLLWGDGTFVAFEPALNFCVSRVRLALGDDSHSPRFVETVPRRGYRFVAPVEVVAPAPMVLPAPQPRPVGWTRALLPALVVALALSPLALPGPRASGPPTRAAGALRAYEGARSLCGPRGWRRSIDLYAEALRADPRFAAAWVGMGESYLALAEHGGLDPDQALPAAEHAARSALALEERADARRLLGLVLLGYEWDWDGSERELRRALALAPQDPAVGSALARRLSAAGRHDEALTLVRAAEARRPADGAIVAEAAGCYYRARRFEDALRALRRLPDDRAIHAHHRLFELFRRVGRDDDAWREAREVMRRNGVGDAQVAALDRLGSREASRRYLEGALVVRSLAAEEQREPPDALAPLHAALGHGDAALDRLEAAARQRYPSLLTTLVDPSLDSLRRHPRFVALARRVGSPPVVHEDSDSSDGPA